MDIPGVIKSIGELTTPNTTESKPINDVFLEKTGNTSENYNALLEEFERTMTLASPFIDEPWWRFHTLVLNELFKLKELLAIADEKDSLLSVSQQNILKSALEMIIVLGIVKHLPKGIGITLKQRSPMAEHVIAESTDAQKCYSLSLTLKCLISLRENDLFKGITSKHHLGDLLASTFAILFPPQEFSVMGDFRAQVKQYLESMIEKEFQPDIIKELMLLLGNPSCPVRVSRAYRGFLSDRIMQKVGVVATIKAVLDVSTGPTSPEHWKTVHTLSKLIVTPHIKQIDMYKSKVYPQIYQLLFVNEDEFIHVAVACVKQMYENDSEACRAWFLDKLTQPLLNASCEDDVSTCIEGLHSCCGIPCSENWALPIKAIQEVHTSIFKLHCKTSMSVYHLKSKVADLVAAIVEQCEPKEVFDRFLFQTSNVLFKFGEKGEVKTLLEKQEPDWETGPELLLQTITEKNVSRLKIGYFEAALNSVVSGELEKKLVSAQLLSELANDESVQKSLNENPTAVIEFVSRLLGAEEQDVEITCLGLMVISVILDDPKYKTKRDWSVFKILLEPLRLFHKRSTNSEVRVLAEELRNTILSHGSIPSTKKQTSSTDIKLKTNVEEAMEEAVDKLLPVRAHGLMSLTKLIFKKDKDTYKKRDLLLCLFKENLKEDDSYVYLAAIEGLAALASSYPDEVLVTLIDQFKHAKTTEIKLKVGETLMKVTRLLNEMAVVYKGELVGVFLLGSQDNDHLIRASSLSNIGELCKILSFRINMYLIDIFQVLSDIVQWDKFVEPRRAAVMVITLLLQGLGKDTFSTLQDLVLEIYRALKAVLQREQDDITKLHAELALQQLNSCTVNFLMPPPKLEKRIFVLDPLP